MGSGKGQNKRIKIPQQKSSNIFLSYDDFMGSLPNDPCLFVMMGIPGSGKSHLSERLVDDLNYQAISSDKIRENILKDVNNQDNNGLVFKLFHKKIRAGLKKGPVIADSTALTGRARRELFKIADDKNVPVYGIIFLDVKTALERNKSRDNGSQVGRTMVPEHAMINMQNKLMGTIQSLKQNQKFTGIYKVKNYNNKDFNIEYSVLK